MEFDERFDRTGTGCVKWDFIDEYFDREEALPMWVADADWKTCDAIIEALKDRVEHGAFGYTNPGKEHDEAIVAWVDRRYDWKIDPEWIVYTNGITPSLSISVRTFTDLGESVVIQPPVYYPFFSVVENNGARVIKNELNYDAEKHRYSIDFKDLEEKFETRDPKIGRGNRPKMMILCNPHNPVGRGWSEEELERIGELTLENDITIVSDEIFSDYVYDGKHTPFSSISEEIAHNSITMIAPTKTFNIAGLNIGIAVIPNSDMRRRFENSRGRLVKKGNVFGLVALKAAYNQGDEWLEAQLGYLKKNKDFAMNFIENEIPKVEAVNPEGTFLLWIDFNKLGLKSEELEDLILNKAKVALNNGACFGESGKGFMRLNFACPRSTLKEGLKRIKSAVSDIR